MRAESGGTACSDGAGWRVLMLCETSMICLLTVEGRCINGLIITHSFTLSLHSLNLRKFLHSSISPEYICCGYRIKYLYFFVHLSRQRRLTLSSK